MKTVSHDDTTREIIAMKRSGATLKEIMEQTLMTLDEVTYRIRRFAPELVQQRGRPGLSKLALSDDSLEHYWRRPSPKSWCPPITGSEFIRPIPLQRLMGAR